MKYTILLFVIWIVYAIGNVAMAEKQVDVRNKRIANKDPRQINHFLWGAGYFAICAVQYLFFKDWVFVVSITLHHASIFPVAWNRFLGNPAFQLSKTTNSLFDKALVKLGFTSTEWVNIGAFAISIFLLTISLFNA